LAAEKEEGKEIGEFSFFSPFLFFMWFLGYSFYFKIRKKLFSSIFTEAKPSLYID
jgi:hypothetical protein